MITIVLFAIGLFLYIIVLYLQNAHGKKYPPGPKSWPFVGNVRQLRELSKKLGGQHLALLELSKYYKSPVISLYLGNRNTIVVSGNKAIEMVLNSDEFDGRPWNYFTYLRNMGMKKGITMNDGPEWKEIRSWFVRTLKSVGFSRRKMSDYITEEMSKALENLGEGGVKRIKLVIIPAVINVLWIFATGRPFDESKLERFIELMERRARAFDMSGGIISAFPWIRFIAPEYSGYNVLLTINNEFKSILMGTIEEHKRNYVAGNESDLIDMFLREMYTGKGKKSGYDEDQLMIILLDVLLAGLNITATTLDFLFLNMLVNQDSQKLLHQEIDSVIGRDKLPDITDRIKMPYMEAVLLESQRLVPVVPVIGPRRVLGDTKLMGYDVSKNTSVLINIFSINADPESYPDPYAFKPERFIRNGIYQHDENLLFFGKGHRQCPGVSLAKSSLFLLFAGIMQRYKLLPVPGEETPKLSILPGMTLTPKPYSVLIKPR